MPVIRRSHFAPSVMHDLSGMVPQQPDFTCVRLLPVAGTRTVPAGRAQADLASTAGTRPKRELRMSPSTAVVAVVGMRQCGHS